MFSPRLSNHIWLQSWRNRPLLPDHRHSMHFWDNYLLHLPVLLSSPRHPKERFTSPRTSPCARTFRGSYTVSRLFHVWLDRAKRYTLDRQPYRRYDSDYLQFPHLSERLCIFAHVLPQICCLTICSKRLMPLPVCCSVHFICKADVFESRYWRRCKFAGRSFMSRNYWNVLFVEIWSVATVEEHVCAKLKENVLTRKGYWHIQY